MGEVVGIVGYRIPANKSQRVSRGGHDVPDDSIQPRFERTTKDIRSALQFVDVGLLIDNRSTDNPYRVLECWEHGGLRCPSPAPHI